MTYEFDGLTFLSAEARAWFINADASAQREWRQKHAPMQAPVHSEIIIDPAPRAESPPAQPGAGASTPTHRNQVLACAENYRRYGWAVVRLKDKDGPANSCGKAAFDDGWQDTTPASPMPNFLPDNNIGIVLGRNSGDLVRLDPEWPKALPLMPILFPEPCPRFGRPSAPGNAYL